MEHSALPVSHSCSMSFNMRHRRSQKSSMKHHHRRLTERVCSNRPEGPELVGEGRGGRERGVGHVWLCWRPKWVGAGAKRLPHSSQPMLKRELSPLHSCWRAGSKQRGFVVGAQCMMSTVKLLANWQEKERFIDVVCDDILEGSRFNMVAASRPFIEIDNHKALVSVKLLDQHRVVQEVDGHTFGKVMFPSAKTGRGADELILRAGAKQRTESTCAHHKD